MTLKYGQDGRGPGRRWGSRSDGVLAHEFPPTRVQFTAELADAAGAHVETLRNLGRGMTQRQGFRNLAVATAERIQPGREIAAELDLLEHGRVRIFNNGFLPLIVLFIETVEPFDDDVLPLLAITA